MEHIVYLLGAGFSAPLGIPIMGNFLFRSQEMFASDPRRYQHFQDVFATIRRLSISKNYYAANLFNIEDILSILEMAEHLEGRRLKGPFLDYIRDVVTYYTPAMEPFEPGAMPGNWHEWLFAQSGDWPVYGYFVGSLFNAGFVRPRERPQRGYHIDIKCDVGATARATYAVVTLNYDLVIETVVRFLNTSYRPETEFVLRKEGGDGYEERNGHYLSLAKLHGSIDGEVVAPTWNKHVDLHVAPAWRLAFQELARATQIRIVGYSLPTADAYVKYLLKAAISEEPKVRNIDVVCLDPDGSVKRRYDEFIAFEYYRFFNRDSLSYLAAIRKQYDRGALHPETGAMILNRLEDAHRAFVTAP